MFDYQFVKLYGKDYCVFRVPTDHRGDVYMSAAAPSCSDDNRAVVWVDAERFLALWRSEPSGRLADVSGGSPETWPSDYKFADAEKGFLHGAGNPVPLADVSCMDDVRQTPILGPRRFLFARKVLGAEIHHTPYVNFTNGVTRTIWLLTAGASCFPVSLYGKGAQLLHQHAGMRGSHPVSIQDLFS